MEKKLEANTAGTGDLELTKGIFHATEYCALCMNWVELPRRMAGLGLG